MLSSATIDSAESYESLSRYHQQKVFFELMSYVKVVRGFKCLDVGCGTGNNTVLLANMVGEEGHVTGVDPDEKRIEVGIAKYGSISNLKFIAAKSVDFPLCEEGYDLIVSNVVMHWVPGDEKIETYKRVFKALNPGGVFALDYVTKEPDFIHNLLRFAPPEVRDRLDNNHMHYMPTEKNRDIFRNIGFEIERLEEVYYDMKLESLNGFFKWVDATLHGQIESAKIYSENRDSIDLEIDADGNVLFGRHGTQIIVKKSK